MKKLSVGESSNYFLEKKKKKEERIQSVSEETHLIDKCRDILSMVVK